MELGATVEKLSKESGLSLGEQFEAVSSYFDNVRGESHGELHVTIYDR